MKHKYNPQMVVKLWLATLCLATVTSSQALTYYTNSAAGNWSSASSWTGAKPPTNGGAGVGIVFSFSTNTTASLTNDFAGQFVLNQITNMMSGGGNGRIYPGVAGASLLFTNTTGGVLPRIESGMNGNNMGTFFSLPVTLATNLTVEVGPGFNGVGGGGVVFFSNITETATAVITKIGGGILKLYVANNYSGGTIHSGGLLEARANGALGTGRLTCNGGNLTNYAASVTLTNAINLASNTVVGTAGGFTLTLSGTLTNTGGIVKLGTNTLVLAGANTYTGSTIINEGTLALGTNGSINNSAQLTLAAGATFDVSAIAGGYAVTGSQTLAAGGTNGTASILTANTLSINAGTSLSFQADGTGDTVGQIGVTSNLTLNANAISVNVIGPALSVGSYRLLSCAGALTNIGTFGVPNINGAGLASGTSASISVTLGAQGYVDLLVKNITTNTLVRTVGNNPSTYGDPITFQAEVSPDPGSGSIITFSNNAVLMGTARTTSTTTNTGIATFMTTNLLYSSGSSNVIKARFGGNATNRGSVGTLNGGQQVDQKPLTISNATALDKLYDGNTSATIAGILTGVVSGDNVDYTQTGYFASSAVGTGISVTSTASLTGIDVTNYTLTQPTNLFASILNIATNSAAGNWSSASSWTGLQPVAGGATDLTIAFLLNTNNTANLNNDFAGAFVLNQITNMMSGGGSAAVKSGVAGASLLFTKTSGGVLPRIESGMNGNNMGTFFQLPVTLTNNLTVEVGPGFNGVGGGGVGFFSNITETATAVITKIGGGILKLYVANNYSGGTIHSGGLLEARANGALGTGRLTCNGGNLTNYAASVTLTNAINLASNTVVGTAGGFTLTLSGTLTNTGGIVKLGTNTLVLAGANTYTGSTIINEGTLALGTNGSINNSAQLTIADGATFDVSAQSAYPMNSNTTLNASGSTQGAILNGAASGTISLGSADIALNYDGSNPALTVSQGTLQLNGNAFNVDSPSPLTNGSYVIITSSTIISNVNNSSFSVTGSAMDTDQAGSIVVSGKTVTLVINHKIPVAALNDPRYKLGYLVVTYYPGVNTNGTGDCRAGIQEALDDAFMNDLVALFPAGTYLISDSLKCFQWWNWKTGGITFAGGGPYFNSGYVLLGSSLGTTRPVIKLMNSPTGNFDDTNNIRPLLVFRLFTQTLTNAVAGTQPTDPMGVPDKYDINTSSLFNCEVRDLDFDCNGHAGAVGVVFPAAQGSVITDVKINATNAFAGVYGLPGRHWGAVNLEVDGGSYGIYCGPLAGDVAAGSAIFGVQLYGQTVAAIDYSDFVSLVMVGFHITKSSNPVLTLNASGQTANNTMVLQDGIIEMDGGAPTTATLKNSNGDTFYARNVYVSGSTNLIKSASLAALTGSGSWSRIDEYSYTDQTTNSGASGVYTTHSMVDGIIQTTAERVKLATANSGPPPVDLLERHLPPAGLPTYEGAGSPPTIVVTDPPYNAIPGDGTNDTLALQRAIDDASAAGHGRVFIPKFNTSGSFSGKFELTNTLVLHSNTMLFGAGKNGVSGLRTHGSWKPAKSVNMIQTDDRAAASTYLGNLELSTTNLYLYPFTAYEWRAGKSSSTFDLAVTGDWISTITNPNTNNFILTRFSGNAGGRHYFFPQTVGMAGNTVSNFNYRNAQIIGTTQPLWFYGFNLEGGKADTRSEDLDIFNAANIRLLGWKREGRASMVVVSNSQNLVLYAAGAMRDYPPSPGVGEIKITGTSSNILMANLLVQLTSGSGPYGLTVMETITGQGSNSVAYPEGVSLYKRGTINESLMQLPPGAPTGLTAVPISSVQVNLAWDEVPGEIGWLVERKLGTNVFNQLAVIGAGITNYSDPSVTATNTYTYRVSATNAAGASPPSLPVTVTTPASTMAPHVGASPASLVLLTPPILANPGMVNNQFGFDMAGVLNQTVVVEVCTNLTSPIWVPLQTNTLNGNSDSFIDTTSPQPPIRYYRLRSQ